MKIFYEKIRGVGIISNHKIKPEVIKNKPYF